MKIGKEETERECSDETISKVDKIEWYAILMSLGFYAIINRKCRFYFDFSKPQMQKKIYNHLFISHFLFKRFINSIYFKRADFSLAVCERYFSRELSLMGDGGGIK